MAEVNPPCPEYLLIIQYRGHVPHFFDILFPVLSKTHGIRYDQMLPPIEING
ncbi:unnamed protein product [Periconia digitata]|uniref:Uncharacterized protein n=1 Tax=Periconia digitata TaxID=1303443 RepID=A0A9W4XWJ9_9PLEO|nr:unnamed protein product [Periconia digitata]